MRKALCIVLVLSCILAGCSGSADAVMSTAPAEENMPAADATEQEKSVKEPGTAEVRETAEALETTETGADETVEKSLDELVSEAIFQESRGTYSGQECAAEGHMILDSEETDQGITAYVLTMYGEYQFHDGNFVKAAGSGVIPAVIVFQTDASSGYEVTDFQWPMDGSGYVESVEEMFPEEYWEICISPSEEIHSELKAQEQAYAEKYLEELGRSALVGEYADFEHTILTQAGVSVEVSNAMLAVQGLEHYPNWLGNVELLENGIRCVYSMELEEDSIVFRKMQYDTGEIMEERFFDRETGEELLSD